jgi:hypothetical protein
LRRNCVYGNELQNGMKRYSFKGTVSWLMKDKLQLKQTKSVCSFMQSNDRHKMNAFHQPSPNPSTLFTSPYTSSKWPFRMIFLQRNVYALSSHKQINRPHSGKRSSALYPDACHPPISVTSVCFLSQIC